MGQKKQRIRDPLHDLIVFDTESELERVLWDALCSRPFQRLRRIKQLGFSELVYPGATHTRFAHSVGVFHTSKKLIKIIRKEIGKREQSKENHAIAAALLHDIGHGPFSHSFETVGKRLNLKFANHERMSDELIRNSELTQILNQLGSGFADDVADVINNASKTTIHRAVVSSQFDADRLDYMRRDRLMTGSQHSAIDFPWLMNNLQINDVPSGIDNAKIPSRPTFVIGPKAINAAEAYVLGLFHLYPNVYFHKATRGAEKLFAELLVRLIELVQNDSLGSVGLADSHPLVQFAKSPDDIESAINLDDAVVWGSLSQLRQASDPLISSFAERLQDRKLFKCVDIRAMVRSEFEEKYASDEQHIPCVDTCCEQVFAKLEALPDKEKKTNDGIPTILLDQAIRSPYKTGQGGINVYTDSGKTVDLGKHSDVVASLQDFKLTRAYCDLDNDEKIFHIVKNIIDTEVRKCL